MNVSLIEEALVKLKYRGAKNLLSWLDWWASTKCDLIQIDCDAEGAVVRVKLPNGRTAIQRVLFLRVIPDSQVIAARNRDYLIWQGQHTLIEYDYRSDVVQLLGEKLEIWLLKLKQETAEAVKANEDWQERTTKGWAEYFGLSKDGRSVTEWASKFNWIKLADGFTRGRYQVNVNDPEVIARRKAATKNNRK